MIHNIADRVVRHRGHGHPAVFETVPRLCHRVPGALHQPLNAASSVGDEDTHRVLKRSVSPVLWLLRQFDRVPGLNRLSRVGTDLLATSIYLNADTKTPWYGEK